MNPSPLTDRQFVNDACLATLGANNAGSVYAGLLTRYLTEPHRAYHTAAHIAFMLRLLQGWQNAVPRPLLLATLFHDAVYDPRRPDNEAQSATLCRTAGTSAGLPTSEIDEAARLILLTQEHNPDPDDKAGVLLTCADLWVLGGSPDEYATYRDQVRQEYAFVPDEAWRVGRARVMRMFLDRPRIYPDSSHVPPGTDEREASARRNVADEIAFLETANDPQ